jgi:spermidine/putrescine-binding protein
MAMTETKKPTKGISRRTLLKTASAAAGLAAGSGAITGFPTIWAQNPITLRQFGTGVSNLNAIAEKCKADLGITLEMTATDSDAAAQRAVTQPNSYDIADIEYWILKKVYPAGVIQPMDTTKLKYYDKIVPLFKNGKLKPDSVIAQGTAPHTVGYVAKRWRQDVRQGRNQVVHDGSDHLQRRHARHPPGPGRPRDLDLGRHHGPEVQGQGLDPQHSRRSASWMPR